MPTIYDNKENLLHEELNHEIRGAYAADFCVGYFRMSGWNLISDAIDTLEGGPGKQCRLLIGMPFAENDRPVLRPEMISKQGAYHAKSNLKARLRRQLESEKQSFQGEKNLLKLREQLQNGKLVAKVYVPEPLHAKLYLLYRHESKAKVVAYLGSSNLTFAGLKMQNELNVDVLEQDAADKLKAWFESRWNNLYALDVTQDLIEIIDESWALNQRPFLVYMKTVYHLCADIRNGEYIEEPELFKGVLLPFQREAYKRAVLKLENGAMGVMMGDVVGLGKTITASAVAKYHEEIHDAQVIIFCPPNLVDMWKRYSGEYKLKANVYSHSLSPKEFSEGGLDKTGDFVIIDESHNLRNPQSQRYKNIAEYLQKRRKANPNTRVLLLTATPYNKGYSDLYAQLSLILDPEDPLPIKPDAEITARGGDTLFRQKLKFEGRLDSLAAFAKSEQRDDWRTLMNEFLIRRTRSFVKNDCAKDESGKPFLEIAEKKLYFPERIPKNLTYPEDPLFARLFSMESVEAIASLFLPRYALGTYLLEESKLRLNENEEKFVANLKRAKTRLKGFCKTNFFKRLESCGEVFKLSLERHLLRNQVFLYAVNRGKPLPIGTLELDIEDAQPDEDAENYAVEGLESNEKRVEKIYEEILKKPQKFRMASPGWFKESLKTDLEHDCRVITGLLDAARLWNHETDQQLLALRRLVVETHPDKKILVFSQFADTVRYLAESLTKLGVDGVKEITGQTDNPLAIVRNFSPKSNQYVPKSGEEIRVLVSSDVLSEGHNLQDCHLVVNYDLPWAIIRLTQRMGRVDRIGQAADNVYCYSVVPEDGLEKLIKLRSRLMERLTESDEVIGSDEVFFEGQGKDSSTSEAEALRRLHREDRSVIEEKENEENDLCSEAYKIWTENVKADNALEEKIKKMPMRSTSCIPSDRKGVIVYVRSEQVDALRMFDADGRPVGGAPLTLLKRMACKPEDPPAQRSSFHHDLVETVVAETGHFEGEPGGLKGSVANQVYLKLKAHIESMLSISDEERWAHDDVYRKPLTPGARKSLRQLLNLKVSEKVLLQKTKELYRKKALTMEVGEKPEVEVVCSMGLV